MKKFLPYILILIISIGLFSPIIKVEAVTCTAPNTPAGCTPATTTTPTLGTCRQGTEGTPTANVPKESCTGEKAIWIPYYYPLSPLPDPSNNGQPQGPFDPTKPDGFSSYLNLIIKLFIGICAVLAVIMIVVGGIEYMTSELPGLKSEGKDRIIQAILGLILALGAWTLLNTINPNLLDSSLSSLKNVTVTVVLADETETAASAVTGGDTFTGATSSCSEGVKKSASGSYLCASIADKYDQMVNAAKSAGLSITGGGYRSEESQKALRVQNCNGNTTDSSAKCNPPTALPGASRHNNGLAIDLKCNGTLIQASDNKCFLWLQANAGKYGIKNLPSEPWHWSVDGR
ncbi:MAG: D-alanyl-D-alanine carboxypeptidase family protein [Candidatus Paceibacterota bacterium]